MCGGGKTQTTEQNQTTAPPEWVSNIYQNIGSQAQDVAQTAYNPATEKQVAGFTAPQYQAFDAAQAGIGAYQPYMANAASAAAAGVAPVTTESIMAGYNPFVQSQVDAVSRNLQDQNAQTMQAVNSNAARMGALTGDRSQIAAQQAMNDNAKTAAATIAGIQSNAYGQAANLAQGNQSAALQGANLYGGLGGMMQQYGLGDVSSLLGIGGLQQGQQQTEYDAATANASQAAAYPYSNLSWLTGIASQLGAGAGQTTSGTTTTPGPNPWAQALGAGLGALSMFSDERIKEDIQEVGRTFDGQPIYRYRYAGDPKTQIGLLAQDVEQSHPEAVGSIGGLKTVNYKEATDGAVRGFAAGGAANPYGASSYIPQIEFAQSRLQGPSLPDVQQQPQNEGMSGLLGSFRQAKDAMGGLGRLTAPLRTTTDAASGWSTTVNPSGMSGWGNYLGNTLGAWFANGGKVRGYDSGGVVPFDDLGLNDQAGWDDGLDDPYGGFSAPNLWSTPPPMSPSSSVPLIAPQPSPQMTAPAEPQEASQSGGLFGLGLIPDDLRAPMLAAGLGMLASNSPNFGNAVGEGGLAGLKTYQQQSRSQQEQALAQRKIAAQADALKQRAAAAAENMRLRQEQQAAMVPYRQAQVENWRSLAAAREKQAATRDAIMGMITGNNGAPAAAPEMVAPQPQSMDAPLEVPQFQQTSAMEPVQGADPRLIKTAGEPSAVPSKTADMIDTPYGRMTRQEAMKKGGVMMLDPQFAAAGRALVDLAKGSDTPGLGKEATNKLEEKQLNTTEGLARLSNISSQFKPEYQTIENRLGFKWNELKDSVGFLQKSVSEPDRQKLAEFSAFRADALNNLNQYIKEITGAAMTNAEADRIMRAMPNPGDGVLNGDSPTVFKAKLDAAIRSSQMALARYNYLRRNGFSGSIDDMATKMPLQKMNDVIQNRTNELLQEAMSQNKGLKPADVAPIVKQRLRQEFGLEA